MSWGSFSLSHSKSAYIYLYSTITALVVFARECDCTYVWSMAVLLPTTSARMRVEWTPKWYQDFRIAVERVFGPSVAVVSLKSSIYSLTSATIEAIELHGMYMNLVIIIIICFFLYFSYIFPSCALCKSGKFLLSSVDMFFYRFLFIFARQF